MINFNLKNNKVISSQELFWGDFGRLRDVVYDTNGYLYLLTSNKDGRGIPAVNDDRILCIIPLTDSKKNISPLEQLKKGISHSDIKCNYDMTLMFKYDGMPACIKDQNVSRLIQRGWR